jgi:hypothetical protein
MASLSRAYHPAIRLLGPCYFKAMDRRVKPGDDIYVFISVLWHSANAIIGARSRP